MGFMVSLRRQEPGRNNSSLSASKVPTENISKTERHFKLFTTPVNCVLASPQLQGFKSIHTYKAKVKSISEARLDCEQRLERIVDRFSKVTFYPSDEDIEIYIGKTDI